ncbi:MAG: protein translocase subunit SecD, partial [Acidobacteria bacterium]|nr:protein translocase subunit SecD [Acidobacteriota bacterium]
MNKSLLWRGLAIAAVVLLSVLSAYPLKDNLKLGLDLRGGIHLVLQVETEDAVRSETDKDLDRMVAELVDGGAAGATAERTGDNTFVIHGVGPQKDDDIDKTVEDFLVGWSWQRRGDDLAFRMTQVNLNEIRQLAVVQALETIRNRIDTFGVTEPVIQRQGERRIVVQLPGVDDPERVKALIKNTAFLEFRIVDYPFRGGAAASAEEIVANYGGSLPDHLEIKSQILRDDADQETGRLYYAVEKRNAITGRDLRNARPGLGNFNQPVVNFYLTHEGGIKFGEVTGANIDKGLAIVLDGNVVSAPNINGQIFDSGIIEGSFTQQEVEDLSTVLRSGALPAGITYLEERTVGPSLGQDSIRRGLRAGVLGFGLVVLAMMVYYKLSGINAVVALLLNIVLIFGALAYFGATLTLPGIAGIVLTIGMAVDANVLIFERIKEELRSAKSVPRAIERGYEHAYSAIFDANITTMIAAVILFARGSGPV